MEDTLAHPPSPEHIRQQEAQGRNARFLKIDFRTLEIMQCDKGTTVEGRGVMVEGLGWCKVWGLGAADRRNLILNPAPRQGAKK